MMFGLGRRLFSMGRRIARRNRWQERKERWRERHSSPGRKGRRREPEGAGEELEVGGTADLDDPEAG
jgi:hypothetical protein